MSRTLFWFLGREKRQHFTKRSVFFLDDRRLDTATHCRISSLWIAEICPRIKQDETNFSRFINEIRLGYINPWKHADKLLRECDQRLGNVMERADPCTLEPGAGGFATWVEFIFGQ